MAENIVVNGVTYNGVNTVEFETPEGKSVGFYPDAVRYTPQELTDAQKSIARNNIGASNLTFVPNVDAEGNLTWETVEGCPDGVALPEVNIKGPAGVGLPGENGWTYIPSIEGEGYLVWEAQRVERPDPIPAFNIVDAVIEKMEQITPEEPPSDSIEGDGLPFETDETLIFESGILRVNTATDAEQDNTLPITSAAVYETLGNIELLLGTI